MIHRASAGVGDGRKTRLYYFALYGRRAAIWMRTDIICIYMTDLYICMHLHVHGVCVLVCMYTRASEQE